MFGRIARLLIDINTDKLEPEAKLEKNISAYTPAIEQVKNQRIMMEEDIKKNIKKAQAKQSHHYNIKHGAGSSYIIRSTVLKKGSELAVIYSNRGIARRTFWIE